MSLDTMRLGKRAPRHDPRTLRLSKYTMALPPAPSSVDWSGKLTDLGMMDNDRLGCCTCSAIGHVIQTWTSQASQQVIPPDSAILSLYESSCGYNPADPSTDQGGVEIDVLNYWRKNPVAGCSLDAYCALDVGDQADICDAVWLFGAAYIGVALPNTAQQQDVWDVVGDGKTGDSAPNSWGGHAIPIVGFSPDGVTVITWGALKKATWRFINQYCDEAYAPLAKLWIESSGDAPSGFAWSTLDADLAQFKPAT